jgi:myo-inositol-1(or 4)-monophosphatase
LDAYYQRHMQAWDYAAGALIADEAGAWLQHPEPANGQLLVAASPLVFEPLRALLD